MVEQKSISGYYTFQYKTLGHILTYWRIDDSYRREFGVHASHDFIVLYTVEDIDASIDYIVSPSGSWELSHTGKEQEFRNLGFIRGFYLSNIAMEGSDFKCVSYSLISIIRQIQNELI